MQLFSISTTFPRTPVLRYQPARNSISRYSRRFQCTAIPLKSTPESIDITSEKLKLLMNKDGVYTKKQRTVKSLASELKTDLQRGLITNQKDFESRRRIFGSNYLQPLPPVSFLEILKEALDDFTILILIISGALSLILEQTLSPGDEFGWLEGTAILATVGVVVAVSAITNYQKEIKFRELSALNEESQVRVVRDGIEQEISCFELLVGDLVRIESGDILQADGILIDGSTLRLDESHLTGESDEVCRSHTSDPFVYSGSKVNEGVGKMLVLAVGANSRQGSIASLASGQDLGNPGSTLFRQKTVLTEKLEQLAAEIGRFGLAAALLTLLTMASQFTYQNLIQDPAPWDWTFLETYLHQLIISITILVVAVPEGLPLASTLALAFSIQRMMKDNNLVRHLEACETMGSITAICTDKTGTLTLNDLKVQQFWIGGISMELGKLTLNPGIKKLISEGIALNSTASLKSTGFECIGNRTECGLLRFLNLALDSNYHQIRQEWSNLEVFPFTSTSKRMSILVKKQNQKIFHIKGAPEIILKFCKFQLSSNGEKEEFRKADWEGLLNGGVSAGLRYLAIAFKTVDSDHLTLSDLEQDLCLIGLIGLSDSVRSEAPLAIQQCLRAGVDVKMLTGDNAATAASIAKSCNILEKDIDQSDRSILEGPEFRSRVLKEDGNLDNEEFLRIWESFKVMARCTPEDKYLLVQGIQSIKNQGRREIIAMTGDGTNDAPALKIADVGFAMASGTPIARDASDILLLDDSFESIVSAMKWGRNVFSSVTKFLQFQLTVNVVAVVTACTGAVFLQESPLSAVQMLWVNLIMDSLASLSLATEPPNDDVLDLPPNLSDAPILSPSIIKNILGQSLYQLLVMYLLVFKEELIFGEVDQVHHFTLVFNAFVAMQLANQLNARKIYNEASILDGLFTNRLFLTIWSSECVLQYLIVQYGGPAFQTSPLSGIEWFICIGFGALSLPIRTLLRQI